MSSTLKTPKNSSFTLTRFAGKYESCVYVSMGVVVSDKGELFDKPIRLTRNEAKSLAKVLNDFANNNEIVE